MEMVLTASANLRKEYSCEIVRISQVTPIEGSDFLGKTEIHPGMPIVVRKDMVKEGDIMFYVDMESQLCGISPSLMKIVYTAASAWMRSF
jgi:hypothetical protein